MKKNYVILISGPTACGKSDFAVQVAKQMNGEIINADIGSMYTPLTIGTAKPVFASGFVRLAPEYILDSIRHHLFDILDQPENFTVVQFRQRLQTLIPEIWSRGHTPIIVGGSGFYIKSFFFKQHDIAGTQNFVQQLEQDLAARLITSEELWNQLDKIDSARAAKIHKNDSYRLVRALAIFHATKQKPSEFGQLFEPLAPFYFINCVRDRDQLYERIDARVHVMMDQGFLREVQELQGTAWEPFLLRKKLIGYDDLLMHLQYPEGQSLDDVIAQIQKKSRNYGKRQIIFLNALKKEIESAMQVSQFDGCVQDINLTYCDVGLYINGLSNQISQTLK